VKILWKPYGVRLTTDYGMIFHFLKDGYLAETTGACFYDELLLWEVMQK
jgi:hypothetical protein